MSTVAQLTGQPAGVAGFAPLMASSRRRLVGLVNVGAGAAALLAVVWAYGLAEKLVVAQDAAAPGTLATESLSWWGVSLTVSLNTSLMLVGAAAGFMGSMVQQSIVFANRAGAETLERGYLWWYLLRPVWSALLGAATIVAVSAGLVSIGDETTSTAGLTVLMTAAVAAGLFTDRVLQQMRALLGAGHPDAPGAKV